MQLILNPIALQGGPVLYPIADIDADVNVVENANTGGSVHSRISNGSDDVEETSDVVSKDSGQLEMVSGIFFEKRVNQDSDDAEEKISNGDIDRNSTDLELSKEDGDTNQLIGIRFRNITIPAGSYIHSAEIVFEIDKKENDPTNLFIVGELKDNANPNGFSNSDYNISNREKTNASVTWANVPVIEENNKLRTPDLKNIVQEVIGQDNWSSGNAMVFMIFGDGQREVESHDGEENAAPLLQVTYSEGVSTPDEAIKQTVGLRFQNVGVPQGAAITSATIEFEAVSSNSGETSLTLNGESHDDSPAFTTANKNLSSRTKTTATVNWNTIPAWTGDNHYQTPDIKTVIQEIVDRSGWCGNNSLSILLEGSGLRNAQSFEGSAAGAPLLNIEYDEDSVSEGACINQAFQRQIISDEDDAEEAENGSVVLSSENLATDETVGLRFSNINIPANTTILEAYIEFTVDNGTLGGGGGTTNLTIKGEKSADAASFSATTNNITSRPQTTASASWSPPSWDTSGEKKQTVDIKAIIQEIVNQGTWSTDNALALIISGTGQRVAESFKGEASNAPILKLKTQGQLGEGGQTVGKSVRTRLKDIVDEINWKGGTPLVDTLYEAARYYRGEGVVYGTTRGNSVNSDGSLNRSEYTRLSHPASYTGGTVIRSAGCTDSTLNSSACINEYISGTATYKSPIALSCQSNHIILLSDGYPSRNSAVSRIESLIGSSCSGSDDGECGEELTEFLYTQDQKNGANFDEDQTIKTHTIGFNVLSSGKAYLERLAAKGGATFYPASSSADLVDAFQSIIGEIISHPSTFAAPSLSVNSFNGLYHNDEVYYSLFLPTKNQRWVGNLKKYKIDVCAEDAVDCEDKIVDVSGNSAVNSSKLIKETARSFWSSSISVPLLIVSAVLT